jgi:hypothetical protein
MTHWSSVRTLVRAVVVVAVAAIPLLALPAPAGASRGGGDAAVQQAVNPTAAGLREFQQRLEGYLQLRRSLAKSLQPLSSTTADSAVVTARQESLAVALRTARRGAKPGDLIPSAVAALMSRTITADLKRRAKGSGLVLSEVPAAPIPRINATYPAAAALSTIPPLLLNNLPKLPDTLQYRFYGRHLVILDGDAQIILDYIANVLPATLR